MLRQGRRYPAGGLQLLILPRSGAEAARAGFVVRRKMGGAVERNLMKRRMREAYRLVKHRVAPGRDLVFSATAMLDFVVVRGNMEELLRQAGALGGAP